jgi:hypothetical protein
MTRPAGSSVRSQRGLALLGLLAVIVMVFAYVLTSRLNAASRFVAVDREHNARVLNRAKLAVIGYALQTAYDPAERNPGRLPCPEAAGNYGVAANEGIAAGNCAVPAVGRLPWRTLGIEKLVDASGEPLWYVVSPGWALPTSTSTLTINPDSLGQITVDGANVVALIIAPGPAIAVQTAAGCVAKSQVRPTAPGTLDKTNYLECGNEANNFVSSAPGKTFNDQLVRIAPQEIMVGLEAAIQQRAQNVIAPALRSAAFKLDTSSPRKWIAVAPLPPPASSNPPVYPYAAPFSDPTASNFLGTVGTNRGLLPFASTASAVTISPTPADPVKTTSNGKVASIVCTWEVANRVYTCTGDYEETDKTKAMGLEMTATMLNAAMGLRARNTQVLTAEARPDATAAWTTASLVATKVLEINDGSVSGKPRGSVTATLSVMLPQQTAMGWPKWAEWRLSISSAVVADHPLLSSSGRALPFSGGTSAINDGNTVTGLTSGASGAVQVLVNSGDWASGTAAGMLYFSNVSGGPFTAGETLQVSGISRATAAGTDIDIGWFARNEWHRNFYYAVAQQNTPDVLPSTGGCTKGAGNCLRVKDSVVTSSPYNDSDSNIRVLLVLAGHRLGTQTRPSPLLSNYLEFENANGDTVYEQRTYRDSHAPLSPPTYSIYAPWNDRVVTVDGFPTGPYTNFPFTPAPIAVQW